MTETLLTRVEFPAGGGRRYPGRHVVVDATFRQGAEKVPAVVKKIRIDWRQRLLGKTKGERSFHAAEMMKMRGLPTPEPLGLGIFADETWVVSRRIEGGEQIRAWFRHRYEKGCEEPRLPVPFEEVVRGLGRLVRALHDRGVFFRDLTDGNVLVTVEDGEIRLWLVDLERTRIFDRPLGVWRRLRELSRPGLNSRDDRNLLLRSYFHPGPVPGWVPPVLSALRKRVLLWDELKRRLRPWRGR